MVKVYIQTDKSNNIVSVNSSIFLSDTVSWIEVDEGEGDKYSHAQSNYLDKPLMNDCGIYLYKYNGEIVEKTEGEIQVEMANIPPPPPSKIDVLEEEVIIINEIIADIIGGAYDE